MGGASQQTLPGTGSGNYLKEILFVVRPWVFFLWLPGLVVPALLAYGTLGEVPPLDLWGMMAAAVFSAMVAQHFFHVAGGSSSTRSFGGDRSTLVKMGLAAGLPAVAITVHFTGLRGLHILALFIVGTACVVGYSIPAIKSEWYWGLGQGIVTIVTYSVLTGSTPLSVVVAAGGVTCLYHNMLHSARLAEGDYDDTTTKRERGYYVQRYSFFVGTILLATAFVL